MAFSRRLGFRSNPAADWETGRRVPTAAMALRACALSKIDVAGAFRAFHPASAPALSEADDAGVAAWLDALRGSVKIDSLARRVQRSRSSVSRWLSGRCRPQLSDFFALVHAITGRVSDLVAELVEIEHVPALLAEHRARQAAKRLAYEKPWTEAILRVIETAEYRTLERHVEGWIAARLGIDLPTETSCIDALERAGLIVRRGGIFVSGSLTVDTVATPAEMNRLKAHWTRVALSRLESPREGDIFSYNVMSVSREALDEIRAVLRGAFRQIRSLAAEPQTEEVVAQVNLQMLSFGAPRSPTQNTQLDEGRGGPAL